MKVFHCDHCDNLVFFENTQCVVCGHRLAFIPEMIDVGSLDPVDDTLWLSPLTQGEGARYRLCRNYTQASVCNWAIPAEDEHPLCASCRMTSLIPDLSVPGNAEAWYRLEVAKRRVLYTLLQLGLPTSRVAGTDGSALRFEFLADSPDGSARVFTGHSNGIVTLNVAEADDVERERRRKAMGEPYRTLLGHFRHEVGHYYWSVLIETSPSTLDAFRERFGDEREDYASALRRHYELGPPPDWQARYVSAYAGAHPWEDWAETWAHYMHLVDSLETAAECGLSLRPSRSGEPRLVRVRSVDLFGEGSFDRMIVDWHAVTYLLNSLNRGMGFADAYPFVLAPAAVDKLRFVHEVIAKGTASLDGERAAATDAVETIHQPPAPPDGQAAALHEPDRNPAQSDVAGRDRAASHS